MDALGLDIGQADRYASLVNEAATAGGAGLLQRVERIADRLGSICGQPQADLPHDLALRRVDEGFAGKVAKGGERVLAAANWESQRLAHQEPIVMSDEGCGVPASSRRKTLIRQGSTPHSGLPGVPAGSRSSRTRSAAARSLR
jgi:hypothetical protein